MVERLCSNCLYWKRNNELNLKRGICSSEKFIDVSDCDFYDDDVNEKKLGKNDTLEYHDFESYKASFSTGEKFGCIHFEEGETK